MREQSPNQINQFPDSKLSPEALSEIINQTTDRLSFAEGRRRLALLHRMAHLTFEAECRANENKAGTDISYTGSQTAMNNYRAEQFAQTAARSSVPVGTETRGSETMS